MAKENSIRVYTIAIGASSGKSKQAVATLPMVKNIMQTSKTILTLKP